MIEVPALDNDPESLAYALKRGFAEDRQEQHVVLDVSRTGPPPVDPPEGVEIVTRAERPELARGMYELACEGFPETFPLTAARSTIASHDITAVKRRWRGHGSPGR